uniref:Bifunctional xylanase/deacetylase n=1 Tax=Pseudobutyrivibrio xylanivorans TaxID=185007 RepID=XY11A_PSEXY|nr:RecName: Full=Bifunctional xylanase/deacetylase; Includes: RecName: Full=Endo-1,4-beta-xylanase 11A; AltName: Full=Xylanase XynT; AltName: Full=Xylanase xyn11A; Includes: RecName: Full=Acetylated xylan deacetylase; Flags: Precursor [Pseudobutyrivibrio xylanivorans]CAD65888.2 endo-1,4-beta-xylanase [Pseudobutyrivibrio xylanivorans]
MSATLLVPSMTVKAADTIYNNKTGNQDGYDYELWKDTGNTSMTLNAGGTFDCSWSNINNALFRKGKKFDSTQTYQQIGNITFDYGCDYRPNGNSYLCVYGWTVDPLVEYYIVDSWGTWRPPGGTPKGQIQVDGGTYDVYETTRYNAPSIQGDTTFKQYFSVRTSKRTSGTISVSEHFKAWERMGMRCGNFMKPALNIEGYQSSGSASVYKNNMTIGGSSSSSGNQGGNQGGNTGNENAGNNLVTVADADKIQCETMTKSGQYTGNISSPFNGVALYANNDAVKYTQYFASGTHDFTLRGCSNNNKMARVDLKIGGQNKGTFYYGDSYPAEYTIKNVSHGTGNQTIELVVTADDGQWDAYLDYFNNSVEPGCSLVPGAVVVLVALGSSSNTGNNSGTNTQNQKLIALTFDDGPSSTTSQVLDMLEKYNVKATFFLIGQNVNSNTASIVQRQVKMGCELACHSYTHEDMTKMNASQIRNQIDWTASAIKNTAGVDVKFFRPPYISVNNTMYQNIDLPFIQGSMHNDWESSTSASQRVNSVLSSAKDGDIILLHDFQGNSQTVSALPQIIEGLKNQGYTFVTVSELFEMKGVNPNVEYKIWSNVK